MKKLICLLWLLALALPVGAYETALDMLSDWEQNGYPADVAGVYSTDGSTDRLTVLLIDGTPEREAEIRAMVADGSALQFEKGTYSANTLSRIHGEISAEMGEGSPVYGCGIGWGQNGGFGESGKESRVVVTVDADCFEEYTRRYAEAYGSAVVVEAGEPAQIEAEDGMTLSVMSPEEEPNPEREDKDVSLTQTEKAAPTPTVEEETAIFDSPVLPLVILGLALCLGAFLRWRRTHKKE